MILRYVDIAALSDALSETRGSLPLPEGETVIDGEWVLAIFEIGSRRRATAAAARGVRAAGDIHLEFERRDWDRLLGFVTARSDIMRAARPVSPPASEKASSRDCRQDADPPRSWHFDDLAPASVDSNRSAAGARVLVVDNDGVTGNTLRTMLASLGLVVELVATIELAEERMKVDSFDALVLDFHAPGNDACAFVGKLRADARIGSIPVLFLSSEPTSRNLVDAFASGGDDFLPKPFRAPELAARIFGLVRRGRIARSAAGGTSR